MASGLSGSLSAYFMYIFALLCVSTGWQIKMLACFLYIYAEPFPAGPHTFAGHRQRSNILS